MNTHFQILLAFFALIRWRNLLIVFLTQYCVYLFLREPAGQHVFGETKFWLLAFSTQLLAAAGYLINDYSDVRIDAINKPEKVIVNRYISARWALTFHWVFVGLGVLIGFYLHAYLGLIHTGVAYLLWRYSLRLKYRLFWGNLVVSFLLALTLLEVYFPFRDMEWQWLLFYGCFAFFSGLVREILKDVEDAQGDEAFGCRTVPIIFGIFRTKLILIYLLLTMCFLLLFVLLFFFWETPTTLLSISMPIYLGTLVLIPLLYAVYLLQKAERKKDFTRLSALLKLVMLSGILSMSLRCLAV